MAEVVSRAIAPAEGVVLFHTVSGRCLMTVRSRSAFGPALVGLKPTMAPAGSSPSYPITITDRIETPLDPGDTVYISSGVANVVDAIFSYFPEESDG